MMDKRHFYVFQFFAKAFFDIKAQMFCKSTCAHFQFYGTFCNTNEVLSKTYNCGCVMVDRSSYLLKNVRRKIGQHLQSLALVLCSLSAWKNLMCWVLWVVVVCGWCTCARVDGMFWVDVTASDVLNAERRSMCVLRAETRIQSLSDASNNSRTAIFGRNVTCSVPTSSSRNHHALNCVHGPSAVYICARVRKRQRVLSATDCERTDVGETLSLVFVWWILDSSGDSSSSRSAGY